MSFDHVMETACAWTIILQTQELKVVQEEELYIQVNIREFNRELCTGLSTLYTETS